METRILTVQPRTNPWTHPITGIINHACDTGWTPEPNSYPSTMNPTLWMTGHIPVPDRSISKMESEKFDESMIRLAKGLSEITGHDIRWHHIHDACCAVFGDYGWFVIEKK